MSVDGYIDAVIFIIAFGTYCVGVIVTLVGAVLAIALPIYNFLTEWKKDGTRNVRTVRSVIAAIVGQVIAIAGFLVGCFMIYVGVQFSS